MLVEADTMAAHISIPKPFASGDASEWFKLFEICSKGNQWNDATKAVKLLMLLEGEPLAILLGLSEEEQDDFFVAKEKLINAMNLTALCCWKSFTNECWKSFTNESYTQVN